MEITLLNCEEVICDLVDDKKCTRDSIVNAYAFAICSNQDVNFKIINQSIIDRWSRNALEYIKIKAWKLIETKKTND